MKTNNIPNVSELANWIELQLSTIIEGVSAGYTLGNGNTVWIDKGDKVFTVSLANGNTVNIDSDNYNNSKEIANAIIETINTNTPSTMNANETTAICPLDFDTVFDAYNYAMAHRHDENPLAVAIPTDAHGTDYGRSLALNGVKLFAVWSDELEETANGYVYTTEAGAREAMAHVEANDKEAGVYEPDYYKVLDMSKYFA